MVCPWWDEAFAQMIENVRILFMIDKTYDCSCLFVRNIEMKVILIMYFNKIF